LKEVYN